MGGNVHIPSLRATGTHAVPLKHWAFAEETALAAQTAFLFPAQKHTANTLDRKTTRALLRFHKPGGSVQVSLDLDRHRSRIDNSPDDDHRTYP